MRRFLGALLAVCGVAALGLGADWPGWRGPGGQGQSSETKLPTKWSTTENVKWKVPLPDTGSSTPVIWGDRVFVTQASDKTGGWPPPGGGGPALAKKRSLLCFHRADGKLLWRKDVNYDEKEATHPTNPFCSASPVTDGERVVVSHGSAGMHCYDFEGKDLWNVPLGKLEHIWGNAASPIIYNNFVILWCGPGERQFLLAVDKKSGKEIWKKDIPGGASGLGASKSWIGSWSTPIVVKIDGRDQMILGVPTKLKGFDPKDGSELWSCDGLTNLVYTSPLYADGVAVAMSGFHGSALAVKVGGSGDITKDRLWHHAKSNPQRIGTGVIVGEHVYMIEENGTPHCFELKTGKEIWESQVEKRPGGSTWSSLVHADGKLYIVNRNGDTLILSASPKYQQLGFNRLGEHTDASIAPSNGELFIRTYKHLWCIADKK